MRARKQLHHLPSEYVNWINSFSEEEWNKFIQDIREELNRCA